MPLYRNHIAKEILHLHLFHKLINKQKVTDLFTVHKPAFQSMLYYQQTPTSIFNQSEDIIETKYISPNSFLRNIFQLRNHLMEIVYFMPLVLH